MITKSPLTGGRVILHKEPDKLMFRNEEFEYTSYEYECADTGQRFTDLELDEKNMKQIYDQYRERHDIPTPAELTAIREEYGLSAAKMSEILGLGTNQYRLYEEGQMPSETIGKMLRSIQTPSVFLSYVEGCRHQMSEEEYTKLCKKIQKTFIQEIKKRPDLSWFREFLSFGGFARKVAL